MRLIAAVMLLSLNVATETAAQGFKPDRLAFFQRCAAITDYSQDGAGRLITRSKRKLNVAQQQAIKDFFDHWETTGNDDKRKLAYIIATAYRETHGTLLPIREAPQCGLDETCRERAIGHVLRQLAIKAGRSKPRANYALPAQNGQRYYGRGYPQLTHAELYLKFGRLLGIGTQLYDNPDLALDPAISKRILIEGMLRGAFAHKSLSDYFSSTVEDWIEARNVLNPGSRRKQVTAAYGKQFNRCL